MALRIGPLGMVSHLAEDRADKATPNEGCIHIHRRGRSVIVSIDLDRLTGPAIAAALYELGDMEPDKVCLAAGETRMTEVLVGFETAARRLCEIFASVDSKEESLDVPWRPGGVIDKNEVKHQRGNMAYLRE